jgi:hypothetical protein
VEVSGTSKERGAVGFTDLGGLLLNQLLTGGRLTGWRQTFRYSVNESACTRQLKIQLAENGAIRPGESMAEWRSTWSVVSEGNDRIDLQRPTGRNIARNNCYP